MKKVKTILAAVALVLAAQGAFATETVSVGFNRLGETVRYADLDLNKSGRAATLAARRFGAQGCFTWR